jgi:hypothetical protein
MIITSSSRNIINLPSLKRKPGVREPAADGMGPVWEIPAQQAIIRWMGVTEWAAREHKRTLANIHISVSLMDENAGIRVLATRRCATLCP